MGHQGFRMSYKLFIIHAPCLSTHYEAQLIHRPYLYVLIRLIDLHNGPQSLSDVLQVAHNLYSILSTSNEAQPIDRIYLYLLIRLIDLHNKAQCVRDVFQVAYNGYTILCQPGMRCVQLMLHTAYNLCKAIEYMLKVYYKYLPPHAESYSSPPSPAPLSSSSDSLDVDWESLASFSESSSSSELSHSA